MHKLGTPRSETAEDVVAARIEAHAVAKSSAEVVTQAVAAFFQGVINRPAIQKAANAKTADALNSIRSNVLRERFG